MLCCAVLGAFLGVTACLELKQADACVASLICSAGFYLVNIDVDMTWRSSESPSPREQGGTRHVITELFTWGDTVLKKEFDCPQNTATPDGGHQPLEILRRHQLQHRLASRKRLCDEEKDSSGWQPWTGFKPSDGTASMDWPSSPDSLFSADQPDNQWDLWPSPGGDRSRDIPLDQACACAFQQKHARLLQCLHCPLVPCARHAPIQVVMQSVHAILLMLSCLGLAACTC